MYLMKQNILLKYIVSFDGILNIKQQLKEDMTFQLLLFLFRTKH